MKNTAEQQFEKMTGTPIPRLIIKLAIPTIISMMITNIYNIVDTAFVGRLGTSASGAVGVVFGLMAIIQAFGFLFGQGSGSVISRLLGHKKTEEAISTASTAFFCSLIVGAVISVFGLVTIDSLVMWLGSTETIAPYAKTYMRYILIAAPFMTTSFTMNNILRYEGKAALGMVGLLFGSILNIAGDYILMFGLNMGIAGAGLATCMGQILSWGILLAMFLKGRATSRISPSRVTFTYAMISEIVLTGLPSLLRQFLNSFSTILLNQLSAPYGDEAVAAMAIVSRIVFVVFSIALGVGQGFQPVCAFNYGAGKYGRVRKAIWFTLTVGMIVMTAAALITMQIPDQIIRVLRDDPNVIRIGHRALILQMIMLPALPLSVVSEMTFQCTGKKLGAAIISSMRNGIFLIPLLMILSRTRGLMGIQEAQPAAYGLTFIAAIFFFIWYMKNLPREDADSQNTGGSIGNQS